ncbi:MAG: alpha/beta hydrolase [Niallia sp.]
MNFNNMVDTKWKLILFIITTFVLLVVIAIFGLLIYINHYKNPDDQKLADAGILEKTIKVGDVTFNYAEGPDNGPPLLLLHAQTLDWYTYSKVLPELSSKFHLFAVDYPGHGKTQVPADYKFSANEIGADLAHFMEDVIQEPAFVTGNSSGGLLTTWLAANKPELVRAIVLEDPPLFSSEYPEIKRTVADKLFTSSYNAVKEGDGNYLNYWMKNSKEFFDKYTGPFSQQIVEFVVTSYKDANPGQPVSIPFLPASVQEMIRGMDYYNPNFGASFHVGTWNEGFDHGEALQKIKCPTLLIHANFDITENGILDGAMSQEQADRAVSLVKDIQYVRVDAAHVTNLEVPDQFVQIVEDFFLGN